MSDASYQAKMVEAVAIAIARADERNGAPPYEQRMTMGKTVRQALYDEAEAAVEAIRQFLLTAQGMR